MPTFRTKLKGCGKGKRWVKHQSCVSNPSSRKFRNSIRFGPMGIHSNESGTKSALTTQALHQHDNSHIMIKDLNRLSVTDDTKSDLQTVSGLETYDSTLTFASEWSHCSNQSFSKFLNTFRYDSALHKEMLAILAALTDVIKENEGKETSSEYFFALLSTLDELYNNQTEKNQQQITALLALLNMGLKTVNETVLRHQFENVAQKMLGILNDFSESEDRAIFKYAFGILTNFLCIQDVSLWSENSIAQQIFTSILKAFSIHQKPKWRKMAQNCIISIVNGYEFKNNNNPPANLTAQFCHACIDEWFGDVLEKSHNSSSSKSGQTVILHILNLLKGSIQFFSKSHIKESCEDLLRLLTMNYQMVTVCSFEVLYTLFLSDHKPVPAKLTGQFITALYDFQPNLNNSQIMLPWIAVIQQSHYYLTRMDPILGWTALPKAFSTLVQLWFSERTDITTNTTHTLEFLLINCVPLAIADDNLQNPEIKSKVAQCFQTILTGLSYQYLKVWPQVLFLISTMFKTGGKPCSDLLVNCLKPLSEIRDSCNFSHNNELEYAVGAAIRSLGPEIVLNEICITKANGDVNLDRSWMLPVLRENIKSATLDFFMNKILPIALHCYKRFAQLAQLNKGIEAHSNELLYIQLWNLLPTISQYCTDIKDNFKPIAKILGMALTHRKELRSSIMSSIRRLITVATVNQSQDDIDTLSHFAKNYLPILFNLYTTKPIGSDEEGQREIALLTIKSYLSIANNELQLDLFSRAMERLNSSAADDPEDSFIKESLIDLIRVLIPYQKLEQIEQLFEHCIKSLPTIKTVKDQKKTFRLLEQICSCNSDGTQEFIRNNKKTIQNLLRRSLKSAVVSSNGARLRCFQYLLNVEERIEISSRFFSMVLPTVVLACKDINKKTKSIAFELLKSIAERLLRQNQQIFNDFIAKLMEDLLDKVPLKSSCTILALTALIVHFYGEMDAEKVQTLFNNVMTLLKSDYREIVQSCLSFVREYCRTVPQLTVERYLPEIMKSLCSMTSDCRNHFRLKTRDIYDYLLRKFNYTTLMSYVPEDDSVTFKRLRNLRKLEARKKSAQSKQENDDYYSTNSTLLNDDSTSFMIRTSKRKTVDEILADSDDDDDNDSSDHEGTGSKLLKKKQRSALRIRDDPNDIVDFTDPHSVAKIHTNPMKNPQLQKRDKIVKKESPFPIAPDGRIIIKVDRNERRRNDDSRDDKDDNDSVIDEVVPKKKQRKLSTTSHSSAITQQTYKSGGIGIHRSQSSASSVKSGKVSKVPGSEYRSSKAKGDVKKKGKLDPYAYLPLQRKALNKRKQKKMQGQFKGIVRGIRKGSKKAGKQHVSKKKGKH